MYLAGDIGGTKTVLALFERQGDDLIPVRESMFPSWEFSRFEQVLGAFFKERTEPALRSACFGVAGTVVDGRCQMTNLPWVLDERALAETLSVGRVKLLNDLEAMAYGMLHLRPEELVPLNPGAVTGRKGNVGVIAAGTGLGEALLYWDGLAYHPIASEGGHGDFGPRTDLEVALMQHLRARFGFHVSYERVLSGPGFSNIYGFLRDRGEVPESPEVAEQLKTGDPNATISELGLTGADPLCAATVDLFCDIYGAEAGNLALRAVAIGGVFLGGGIAPKILPALQKGGFLSNFIAKGRFADFLKPIDIRVALNPAAPLLGAAHYAARL